MLDSQGRFDDALNKEYLAYLAENGVEGVLVLGTTGEFASFSVAERKLILESFLRHRGRLPIIAHVGTPNLPETLDLLEHAISAGADAVLVIPPFYFKNVNADGLAGYFEPILKASRLPVVLYNIPQISGVPITSELLYRLAPYDTLYGVKDSHSKGDALTALIREFPSLKIFTGVYSNVAADLCEGGAGAITGNGSVLPRETAAIFDAWRSGGDPWAAQKRLDEAVSALGEPINIPLLKFALSSHGLRLSASRPPFTQYYSRP